MADCLSQSSIRFEVCPLMIVVVHYHGDVTGTEMQLHVLEVDIRH